jgi:hypothetical protein
VRPVPRDHRLVGKRPEGSRQPEGETRTPARLPECCLVEASPGRSPAVSRNLWRPLSPLHFPTHRLWRVPSVYQSLQAHPVGDDALPSLLGPSCLPGELIDQLVHRVP